MLRAAESFHAVSTEINSALAWCISTAAGVGGPSSKCSATASRTMRPEFPGDRSRPAATRQTLYFGAKRVNTSNEPETGPWPCSMSFQSAVPRLAGVLRSGLSASLRRPGGTCTGRPNRGGTAVALTIGPAAPSVFRRASTCRFRPSRAHAPSIGDRLFRRKQLRPRSPTYSP